MRLTIIPDDSLVIVNNDSSHRPLDISNCGIPKDVHALQWFENKGWVEFDDPADPFLPKPPNEIIDVLPQWANYCVQVWENWTPPAPTPTSEVTQPTTSGTMAA